MKRTLITPEDLLKFMREEKYYEFLKYLRKENNIPKNEPLWIILEWSESKND